MSRFARLRSAIPQLSIIAIVLAFFLIGLVMNHWFIRSADAELQANRQNMNILVMQTIGREYQRYSLLVNEFENVVRGPAIGEDIAKTFLERSLRNWGPNGLVPGLVKSALIVQGIDPAAPTWSVATLNSTNYSWQHQSNSTFQLPQNVFRRLEIGELVVHAIPPGPSGNGELYLIGRSGQSGGLSLILVIDGQGFYDTWVAPALRMAIPGANIERVPGNRQSNMMDQPTQNPTIDFNPLATLLGIQSNARFVLNFPLLRFGDFYRGIATPPESRGTYGTILTPQPRRFIFTPMADRMHVDERWGNLRITLNPQSSFDRIKLRLALNWLGTMSMLTGVGVAFIIVVLQVSRLRETRRREREFVAAITHELRTPLTVIQSCADNIVGGIVTTDRLMSYGELIRDQCHRLGHMIEDVLRFAGVEGRPETPPELVTLFPHELIANLQQCLDPLSAAHHTSIAWEIGSLPLACRSDPDTLRLILENLVVNAMNHAYGPQGGGPIRVSGGVNGADRLWFSVEDDGRGIPSSESQRVFQPFFRGKASRLNQESGAGLGLHLARRKARLLGGDLRLESPYRLADGTRNGGCRFTLTIPLILEDAHA